MASKERKYDGTVLSIIAERPGILSTGIAKVAGLDQNVCSAVLSVLYAKKKVQRVRSERVGVQFGSAPYSYYPKGHELGTLARKKRQVQRAVGSVETNGSAGAQATVNLPFKSVPGGFVAANLDECRNVQKFLNQLLGTAA